MFPAIDAYDEGMLDVGDGHRMYFAVSGNPDGLPALVVHGGPGSGSAAGARRFFDPGRYRTVQFDQRMCGRSTPNAADPDADLRANTTGHLLADMERLRVHLGVERWVLFGGSWGSTLILAYAERYPERVAAVVLNGVTTGSRAELDWLYRGVGRFLPAQWERFAAFAGHAADLPVAYDRLLGDPATRDRAVAEWVAWEDAVIAHEVTGKPDAYSDRPPRALVTFVRICAHYFARGCFLDGTDLVAGAARLAGIPAVLIHGRLDLGGPLDNAWKLARAWPGSELVVIEGAGHTGGPATTAAVLAALDRFARLPKTASEREGSTKDNV
ncbi:prolyl aminopeptidase [Dactylosporangium vinaceum]|uniref:Proline iminopeptidase n=1 Tax=Dactylosporangium vinaceum TaxID=53362 RepID=A0ABV5M8W4_9ACTN|nr:prolyl aminopeptidase [Dactylosporangium vinaceum]UAB99507.1 prolyl aminopeptidase [Dactylosporangium vinaceum]